MKAAILYLLDEHGTVFVTHNLTSTEIELFPAVTNISEFDSADGFSSPHDAALRTAFSTLFSTSGSTLWTALQNYIAGLGCEVPDLSWFNTLFYFFPDSFYSGVDVFLNSFSYCPRISGGPSIVTKYAAPQIKRIQRYKFTKQSTSQSLCSLKETGYTKITGFRKWSL